jgi:hypothetical protein
MLRLGQVWLGLVRSGLVRLENEYVSFSFNNLYVTYAKGLVRYVTGQARLGEVR